MNAPSPPVETANLAELFEPLNFSERRRTILIAADALCLCARANGIDNTRLKILVLMLRMPELGILTDDEAMILIHHLGAELA